MQRRGLRAGDAPRRNRGFTLVELLVVIVIITILAAILFPVYAQVRAMARQTTCLSNMKQIGTGLMMYAQDYDETLPGNSRGDAVGAWGGDPQTSLGWMTPPIPGDDNTLNIIPRDLQPYVRNVQIFVCPQAVPRRNASEYADPVVSPRGGNISYLFNGVVMFRPLLVVPAPADVIFLREESQYQRYAAMRPFPRDGQFYGLNWYSYDNLHHDGGNLLFCDSHVKWQRKSQIGFEQFGVRLNPSDSPGRKLSAGDPEREMREGWEPFTAAF